MPKSKESVEIIMPKVIKGKIVDEYAEPELPNEEGEIIEEDPIIEEEINISKSGHEKESDLVEEKLIEKEEVKVNKKKEEPIELNDLLNKAEKIDEELNEEEGDVEEDSLFDIKSKINDFMEFITSGEFSEICKDLGAKYNVSPKRVAKTFFQKVLGTIGDVLGIALNVTENSVKTIVTILYSLLHGFTHVICKIAQKLVNFFTGGFTAVKTQ